MLKNVGGVVECRSKTESDGCQAEMREGWSAFDPSISFKLWSMGKGAIYQNTSKVFPSVCLYQRTGQPPQFIHLGESHTGLDVLQAKRHKPPVLSLLNISFTDMEVDMVANMVTDMVLDMEYDNVADMVIITVGHAAWSPEGRERRYRCTKAYSSVSPQLALRNFQNMSLGIIKFEAGVCTRRER